MQRERGTTRMLAIYKRELRAYFQSMTGYVFIAFLICFTGIYFMAYNLNYGYPYFSYVLSGTTFIYFIAIPFLTMRSFAEERKNKTDQLLFTSPVGLFGIIAGKYLAMVTILAVPCIVYLMFPWMIKAQGTAYVLQDSIAIFVFFLMGCVFIAIGMFLSSLTESQILAAIGTVGVLLVLYLWSGILEFIPDSAIVNAAGIVLVLSALVLGVWKMTQNWFLAGILEAVVLIANVVIYLVKSSLYEGFLGEVLGKLDLIAIFSNVTSSSVLDISGLILYVSLIGVFLFLTIEMIQKRRWS